MKLRNHDGFAFNKFICQLTFKEKKLKYND
jgi:hypothetical protein